MTALADRWQMLPEGFEEAARTVPFGKPIPLPDPVGVELDTEPLKNRVR